MFFHLTVFDSNIFQSSNFYKMSPLEIFRLRLEIELLDLYLNLLRLRVIRRKLKIQNRAKKYKN